MRRGLVLGREKTRAFQRDVDVQRLVRQLGRIAHRGHLHLVAGRDDVIAVDGHIGGKAAMYRIVAQQMRVGLDRAQVVGRHHFDVAPPALHDGAEHKASDAAEAVDCDADGHFNSSNRRSPPQPGELFSSSP